MFKSFGVYALIMFHRSQNGSGPTLTDDILSFNEVNADSSKSNNLSEKISSYSEAFQVSVPKVEVVYSGCLKSELVQFSHNYVASGFLTILLTMVQKPHDN